jgi:hypothetical protein
MQLPLLSVLNANVQGTWREIVGANLRVVHVAGLGMKPRTAEPGALRETGSRVSYATEDNPPDRLRE